MNHVNGRRRHGCGLLLVFLITLPWLAAEQPSEIQTALMGEPDAGLNQQDNLRPPPRDTHAIAYDVESDRTILYGGDIIGTTGSKDTWAYDFETNQWVQKQPPTTPPPLWIHRMAYDAESDRIIIFGGDEANLTAFNNETWAYDFNADMWTKMNPEISPPSGGPMTYDIESDRVILVYSGETWAYDFNEDSWMLMSPAEQPPSGPMAYDSESDRAILFSGGETWAYHFNADEWVNMTPDAGPPRHRSHRLAYDLESDRIILFGGFIERVRVNDTWAYDFNANAWTEMSPSHSPWPRTLHAMSYDSQSDRIILFGGQMTHTLSRGVSNATWAYDFNTDTWTDMSRPQLPPWPPDPFSAVGGEAIIALEWLPALEDGGSPVTGHRVYRGTDLLSLELLAELGKVFRYTDTDVQVNVTYYYAVSAVNVVGEGPRSLPNLARAEDTTSPAIMIASPLDGAILNQSSVTVTGSASDNVAVERVECGLEGGGFATAEGISSWSVELVVDVGNHTVACQAFDTSGNRGTAEVTIQVAKAMSQEPEPSILERIPGGLWSVVVGAITAAAVISLFFILRRRRG